MARKKKKKSARPRSNPNLKAAVKAAYKLGLMDGEEKVLRRIREGSLN